MADETPPPSTPAQAVLPSYEWLRWAIRITGILLMFGGTIYLGVTASQLLTDNTSGSGLFVVVVTVAMLGLGIYVLRTGLNMLRSIDAHTIGSFCIIFALIYTWILAHILSPWEFFKGYPALMYLLVFLYFGLSYWILKSILFRLLLPRGER